MKIRSLKLKLFGLKVLYSILELHAHMRVVVSGILDLSVYLVCEVWFALTDVSEGESWLKTISGCIACAVLGLAVIVMALGW